jgi:prepilin-type N-terminal cleavage/methylation domain-containing protein
LNSGQSGLTLIELMVVMMIFALGWFALLPALNPQTEDASVTELNAVNSMLSKARLEAMSGNGIQRLMIQLRGVSVAWGSQTETLPSAVSDCQVNGKTRRDQWISFRIYPSGVMDELRLSLGNGVILAGAPLTASLSRVQ